MKRWIFLVVVLLCVFGVFGYISFTENNAKPIKLHNQSDIPYNDLSEQQKFDISFPNKNDGKKMPVVIYIHGGSYNAGNKEEYETENEKLFNDNGYIYVSANYRLSGEKKFPAAVDDIKTLIRYLKDHAKEYNIDKNKINLMGFSAGANLISMLNATEGTEALGTEEIKYGDQNSKINTVVSISGFYDVQGYFDNTNVNGAKKIKDRILQYYLNEDGQLADNLPNANNMAYMKNFKRPMLILHAKDDKLLDVSETVKYCKMLKFGVDNPDIKCDYSYEGGHSLTYFVNDNNSYKIINWLKEYN